MAAGWGGAAEWATIWKPICSAGRPATARVQNPGEWGKVERCLIRDVKPDDWSGVADRRGAVTED